LADRRKAVDAGTQDTIDQREAENARRAGERRAATKAAEGNLNSATRGKKEQRAKNDDFTGLLKEIESVSSLEQLRDLYTQYDALSSNGRLTSGQISTLETALEDAQERVSKASSSMGGKSSQRQVEDGAAGAGLGGPSKAEVAGTFSSVALGGMGFGSSLAQKQLDALTKIEQNTREGEGATVAA
jgi:multidrug resistance efflux pump